jgi:pimeloyl-ACP methyl ester carboxylesterase
MPNAEIEVVRGGHLPWLDDPVGSAEAVSGFLRARSLVH